MTRSQELLDLFYPVDIVGSTAAVQSSGTESFTVETQSGKPSITITQFQTTSGENSTTLFQSNLIVIEGTTFLRYEGASSSTTTINPDFRETIESTTVIVPTLSGQLAGQVTSSAFLQGVVGTSGSIEKFFDTSPFLFTDHETDPNTERDISELEPFMIFSSATITTVEFTRRIPTSTTILIPTVSAAGDDFLTNKTTSFASFYSGPPSLDQVIGGDGIILDESGTVTGTTTTLEGPVTFSGAVDIAQSDEVAPFFDETQPVSGTRFNDPTDLGVEFHIKDNGIDGLDTSTMNVWIDGLQVIDSSALAPATATWPTGFRTVLGPNDYQFSFIRGFPFDQQATVVVSGELGDVAGNTIDTEYNFTMLGSGTLGATITGSPDGDAPVITPINPVDLQVSVSPDTDLIWTLVDIAAGVDPAGTRLLINGVVRLENDVAIDGSFSRTGNSQDGFTYTFNPDEQFEFASTVTGTIEATDLATSPNTDSLDYEFTIAPTDSLQITNFFLSDGESTLLTSGTAIEVDITDTLYGVNVSGTFLTINGTTPAGISTSVITSGIRFSIPAEPIIDYREDLEVFVHAENLFPGDFPQIEEETFRLLPGYDVTWANRILDDYEVVFPYITRIEVLADIKNFAKNFNASNEFFDFLTENQASSNMGALLISNIKVADMPAVLTVLNTFYEYGKTIVLEIEVDDLDGNQLRFIHTYTIEPRP